MALGLLLGLLATAARADEPLRPSLDNERIQARLNDRLVLPGQGRSEQQKDLRISVVPPPIARPSDGVRARAEGATLREQKTKRVAATQN